MPRTREEILRERRQLRVHYGLLFDAVATLLFRHDPIGIAFDENVDEYESEGGTILPRLRSSGPPTDPLSGIYEGFVPWFSIETAGPKGRYTEIASEIWHLWQTHRLTLRLPAPDGT